MPEEGSTHESRDLEFQLRVVFHDETIRGRRVKDESLTNYKEKTTLSVKGQAPKLKAKK